MHNLGGLVLFSSPHGVCRVLPPGQTVPWATYPGAGRQRFSPFTLGAGQLRKKRHRSGSGVRPRTARVITFRVRLRRRSLMLCFATAKRLDEDPLVALAVPRHEILNAIRQAEAANARIR